MKKIPQPKVSKLRNKAEESAKASAWPPNSYGGQAYDVMLHGWMSKFTNWISPASLGMATFDWVSHILASPAKQFDLAHKAWDNLVQFSLHFPVQSKYKFCIGDTNSVAPAAQDRRFKDEAWDVFPFNLYAQGFLLYEKWWNEATSSISGVSKHHEHMVNFTARQILDMFSPANFPLTNPEVLREAQLQSGANFVAGMHNFMEDSYRIAYKQPPAGAEKYVVGEKIAVTEGKVIYRNHLMELIQYVPTTATAYPEPILVIPAWIMKYYILDLSPHNSLVKYLVDKGHTVFIISWKNPTTEDANLRLNDYLSLGIMDALNVVREIVPNQKIHAAGYCLGGTLLAIAAAAMAQTNEDYLESVTLFAAQVDFRDPGELSLFIDEDQITYLESIMAEKGYLDGSQMAWAFSMLRSNDLIWSRMVHDYLLGKRRPINDLIAWDHDTTRLPFRMHSEYLRNLFLKNELVHGRYKVENKKIALVDINAPIFAVGTVKDHVSPWRSVYKIQLYTNTDVTFVLTTGGHNAGIVNEPGHKNRSYQINTHEKGSKHISSDTWLEKSPHHDGSWWPAWQKWLAQHSGKKTALPTLGNSPKGYSVLCDAPGTYVLQK